MHQISDAFLIETTMPSNFDDQALAVWLKECLAGR